MLLPLWGQADAPARDLLELLEYGEVTLSATALGGHSGHCIEVNMANRSPQPVRTAIPAGWRFPSEHPGVQDLIVVQEAVIAMAGGGTATVTCRAFCCKAAGRSPWAGDRFRTGGPAAPGLYELANTIGEGNYGDDEVQHAIWTLSDGYDIAGMGAMDSTANDELRRLTSRLSGQPLPTYRVRFADDPGQACSGRPASIHRTITRHTGVPTAFSAVVLDPDGRIVQVLYDHATLTPGARRIDLQVDVSGWPPGRYAFHVWSSDRAGARRMPFIL